MFNKDLIIGMASFIGLHTLAWFGTNMQLVKGWEKKGVILGYMLAIPITFLALHATKFTFDGVGSSAWKVRFIGFALSYLTFPILTYMFLDESMLNWRTVVSIALSFLIIAIQIKG